MHVCTVYTFSPVNRLELLLLTTVLASPFFYWGRHARIIGDQIMIHCEVSLSFNELRHTKTNFCGDMNDPLASGI